MTRSTQHHRGSSTVRFGLGAPALLLVATLSLDGLDEPVRGPLPRSTERELFEREVRPLLVRRCGSCHGAERQKSGLRLDHYGSIFEGGERGPAVVPGDADGSLLVRALRYDDQDLQMPPDGRLDADELALLERWVARGAVGPGSELDPLPEQVPAFDLEARKAFWSFRPVRPVEPPAVPDAWPATAIDRFVLARLLDEGLAPADDAERHALLRRLAFDLTGLPPTPAEVTSFVEAPGDPFVEGGAWDAAVAGYLASEHFGERWGRHWLDLVRYAESRGHEYDFTIPNAWQYRDWVVRALNADVPYDRFVLEHLAGDLLDEPRPNPEGGWDESVLGTGFWYLGEEVHSPVDIRTDQCDRIANQVDVVSKAFLGLTVACARCHDHKFDPITQADFYALAGFAKSSRYRQVRFETREHNERIARELASERERHAPEWIEAVRPSLVGAADELEDLLLAAADAVRLGPLPIDDGRRWPDDLDLLFEDFEAGDWGAWTVDGDAIGDRPTRADEAGVGEPGQRGASYLNTWAVFRDGAMERADHHVGSLESPPFVVERDWIHFLIGGGAHTETAFELVVAGEVVRTASGQNSNRLEPARFDVRDLRGREATLRAVDRHTGGWGQIALDHVVFSNEESSAALATELRPAAELGRRERIWSVAAARGLDPARVRRVVEELEGALDRPAGPWYPFARVASSTEPAAALAELRASVVGALAERTGETELFAGGAPELFQDGFVFTRVQPGDVRPSTTPSAPLARVWDRAAWVSDPTWNVLTTAPSSQADPSLIEWTQAGRTLHTPSFRLERPKLAYRVRGAGHVYAAVCGHRMIRPPLHERLVHSFEDTGTWTWVVLDLTDYEGETLHLELSPADDGRLELGPVLMVAADWEPPIELFGGWLDAQPETLDELAAAYASELERAIASLGLPRDERRPVSWTLLDAWLRSEAFAATVERAAVTASLDHSSERMRALLDAIRTESRLAPAIFDGSGVDEELLARGSARAPRGTVERRFLEALDGADGLAIERGSGRLELARRFVDPDHPFLARVRVNRVWKHLIGRGLVPSVDDFGAMGEEPSHPDLLDWLARTFVADGWSQKALIRRIVRSRTYRLSSRADPAQDERDPTNRWLHRAHVRRLEGEAIRDAILFVSGGLDPTPHGPPVPIHLTAFEQGRGRPESGSLDGGGRRSLYLSVRRNFLSPFFLVFDAPTPATTVGQRSTSNVPAQALTLLNDPFVLAEAERWASTLDAGADDHERIERLFLAALARPPSEDELRMARAFLAERRSDTTVVDSVADPWAELCHVLINVKEFVYLR